MPLAALPGLGSSDWYPWARDIDGAVKTVTRATDGFGLVGGGLVISDLVTTAGSAVVTSASNPFTSAHVGRTVVIIEGSSTASTLPVVDFATFVTTVQSVESAGSATLAALVPRTLTAGEAYVVANDTTGLQAWLNSAPTVGKAFHSGREDANKTIGEGRVLVLPPGVYGWNGTLEIPHHSTVVLDGVTLVATGTAATIVNRTRAGVFEQGRFTLTGSGVIEGAYLGVDGINLLVANKCHLGQLTVQRFTQDGIRFRSCQWNTVQSVNSIYNGRYGIHTSDNADGIDSANIRLLGSRFHLNGSAGWYSFSTDASWAVASTFQFHAANPGVRFFGRGKSPALIGCHFEGNARHVIVQDGGASGRPSGVKIDACHFVNSGATAHFSGVERWVDNQGDDTTITAPTSQASTPITTLGTTAPIQQSTTLGSITVLFPGVATGITDWVCYEDGTPYREGNAAPYRSRVAIVRRIGRGVRFDGSYRHVNPGTEGDLLRIEDSWVWLDSTGRLVTSATKPATQDAAGRAALSVARYQAARVDAVPAAAYAGETYTVGSKTLSNTAVLAADTGLEIASVPVGRYKVDGLLVYESSAVADIQFRLTVPTGATYTIQSMNPTLAVSGTNSQANFSAYRAGSTITAGGNGAGSLLTAAFSGFLEVTTAGTVGISWAQNTAEVSNTIVHTQSYLRLS